MLWFRLVSLQDRLSTFSLLKWFFMPNEINAMECAKSGYVNTGPNQIRCVVCHHQVLIKTQVGVLASADTVQRMVNRVIYGHKPD